MVFYVYWVFLMTFCNVLRRSSCIGLQKWQIWPLIPITFHQLCPLTFDLPLFTLNECLLTFHPSLIMLHYHFSPILSHFIPSPFTLSPPHSLTFDPSAFTLYSHFSSLPSHFTPSLFTPAHSLCHLTFYHSPLT